MAQDRSNDAKNAALITEINVILQYIQYIKQLLYMIKLFGLNQCRLGEKRLLKKT